MTPHTTYSICVSCRPYNDDYVGYWSDSEHESAQTPEDGEFILLLRSCCISNIKYIKYI